MRDPLRSLDDRLVPRAAVALRGLLDALRRDPERSALRRLDDRFARGPLRILRDVPQLAALLAGLVLVTASVVALARDDDDEGGSGGAETAQTVEDAAPLVLGPAPGDSVATHVAAVRSRTSELADAEPDGAYTALVSLRAAVDAPRAQALLGDLRVRRVLLRLDLPVDQPAEVVPLAVTDLQADLTAQLSRVAAAKAAAVPELRAFAETIDPALQPAERAAALADVAAVEAEAAGFVPGCTCLVALVVEGPAARLAALGTDPDVRVVELARRGAAVEDVEVRPLLPGATGVVPPPASSPAPYEGAS